MAPGHRRGAGHSGDFTGEYGGFGATKRPSDQASSGNDHRSLSSRRGDDDDDDDDDDDERIMSSSKLRRLEETLLEEDREDEVGVGVGGERSGVGPVQRTGAAVGRGGGVVRARSEHRTTTGRARLGRAGYVLG